MCMHYLRGLFTLGDGDGVHALEWTLYPFLSDLPYRWEGLWTRFVSFNNINANAIAIIQSELTLR